MLRAAPAGTQAVIRALRLLKSFAPENREMSLQDLMDATGLSRSTTHRLLAALKSESLVERITPNGGYRLASGAVLLAQSALASRDLRARLHPVLEALARDTGETATLEVLAGSQMLIVDEVAGNNLTSPAGNIGTRWPVHATATGKALLATVPDPRILLRGPLRRYTPQTLTTQTALVQAAAEAGARGYAVAVDELEEGFTAIAVALAPETDGRRATLSLGGPSQRLVPAVENLAARLLRTLGRPT